MDRELLASVREEQQAFGGRLGRVGRRAEAVGSPAGEMFVPQTPELPGVLLYFHGGGYVAGDGEFARGAASVLASRLGMRVCCADYRLAPEHPCPAAPEDALAAYRALRAERPEPIVLFGDSAGGGLAFVLAQRLRREKLPLPAGIIAVSPWADLSLAGADPDGDDGFLNTAEAREWAALYAAGRDLRDPELSPLYGDCAGLPPALLFADGGELLLPDIRRLRDRLRESGGEAELLIAPGMGHDYLFTGRPAAREDYGRMRGFLARLLQAPPPSGNGAAAPQSDHIQKIDGNEG